MIEDDVQDISKLYREIFDGNLNGTVNFELAYNSENVGDFYFIYIYPNNQRQQYPVDIKAYQKMRLF
jgi:hypothetical protein